MDKDKELHFYNESNG